MTIAELEALWDADCEIKRNRIEQESLDIAKLHNKYFKLARREKTKYRGLINQKNAMQKTLFDYYAGNLNSDPDALAELGYPPMAKKLTKDSIERNIASDKLFVQYANSVAEHEEIMDYLSVIIERINKRSFDIKNHIEYLKWSKGQN